MTKLFSFILFFVISSAYAGECIQIPPNWGYGYSQHGQDTLEVDVTLGEQPQDFYRYIVTYDTTGRCRNNIGLGIISFKTERVRTVCPGDKIVVGNERNGETYATCLIQDIALFH